MFLSDKFPTGKKYVCHSYTKLMCVSREFLTNSPCPHTINTTPPASPPHINGSPQHNVPASPPHINDPPQHNVPASPPNNGSPFGPHRVRPPPCSSLDPGRFPLPVAPCSSLDLPSVANATHRNSTSRPLPFRLPGERTRSGVAVRNYMIFLRGIADFSSLAGKTRLLR